MTPDLSTLYAATGTATFETSADVRRRASLTQLRYL
jgi:hypothetical protein